MCPGMVALSNTIKMRESHSPHQYCYAYAHKCIAQLFARMSIIDPPRANAPGNNRGNGETGFCPVTLAEC